MVLAGLVEQIGHKAVEAPDGETGLRLFSEQSIDLVITDIFMPGISGLDVIQKIKDTGSQVKIIAVTAHDSEGEIEHLSLAKRMGADRAFPKPFNPAEFREAMVELLSQ